VKVLCIKLSKLTFSEEHMRRFCLLLIVSCLYLVPAVWAQQTAIKPHRGRHLSHPSAATMADLTVTQRVTSSAESSDPKIWELGTYPRGTWVATWHINDYGMIVGLGDVPPIGRDGLGYTHTLAVPLFGPTAGQWIDLGALRRKQSKGWEEPLAGISNTGLVVSGSIAPGGDMHAEAWTQETGLVDLGTLADTGDPRYANHNSGYAISTNKLGTLIVGGSGVDEDTNSGFDAPVAWTQTNVWTNGKSVTKWKIHALDTSAYPGFTWMVFDVNNYGQIIGIGYNADFTICIGALWNPRTDGIGWRLTALPPSSDYPLTIPFGINNGGQIAGIVQSLDGSIWLPTLWKPLDWTRTTYSNPAMLPLPQGGFTYAEAVSINDLGDIVGDSWNGDGSVDLPSRWTSKDLTFAEIINFPADWGFSWGVNNNRIASVTYTGDNCPSDTYGSCVGAIQLH